MIKLLVKSAFETGCLSVASESLIQQILKMSGQHPQDFESLQHLENAIKQGQITREAAHPKATASSFVGRELVAA